MTLLNSEKTVEVAELPYRLNIQYFADDEVVDDVVEEPVDEPVEEIPEGEKVEEVATPQESFKDDPQNQAFAQMRREKEAYEQQVKTMDAEISRLYGDQGIHTFADYQKAVEEQRQAEERQKLENLGLPDDVIDKLSKVDEIIQRDQERTQQEQQQKAQELINTEFDELTKEHPDLGLKEINDLFSLPIYQQMHDKVIKGYSLLDAYEVANRAELRAKTINSGKQSALNQINSKSHIRGNGGEGADDVDLTSVPAETMQMYRAMFKKELKTGKMKESDFVKHYKNSN